jgi:MoaA/NifB/PqqE/SkfB family radical SAM enzyme
MSESLGIIIPDYKSPFLEQVIKNALLLNPEKIVVSNFETPETLLIQNKFNHIKSIQFLNFNIRKNPGDYRNEGVQKCFSKNLLFLDSDIRINSQSIGYIEHLLKSDLNEDTIYWGIYSKSSQGVFSKIQNKILRYRFSKKFFNRCLKNNKPYCGQSSHFLITRKTFNKIGGFNPYLRIREDNDFCIRSSLLGIKNSLDEKFEADHLKFFSLYSDYFQKPFHATKVKIIEPKIFNKASSQIGLNLLSSWIVAPIFFVILSSLLFFSLINVKIYLLGNLLSLPISFILLPKKISNDLNFKEKVYTFFLLPLIGFNFLAGGLLGFAYGLFLNTHRFIVFLIDYTKIFFKIIYRNGNPIQIVNFITARCNLRCNHCFYKDTLNAAEPGEMNLSIINEYTKNFGSVLWYALGGGEPFIRSDLYKLYEKVETNCRPKVFTIPTNGWYKDRIFLSTLRMLQFSKGKRPIIIQFSLDGNKEMHDQIRGNKSHEKVLESLEMLKQLQKMYKQLHFSVITVVTNENRDIYPQLIDDLLKFETNQININLFRYGTLDHPPIPDETLDKYKASVERYEGFIKKRQMKRYSFLGAKLMRLKEALQKDLIYDVAKNDKFVTPCTAGSLSYVVWEDGRVNACEILPDTIGNVNNSTFPKNIFKSNKAKELRKKIKDTKCKCTYECAMSTNTFFSWNMTKKLIWAYISNRV